MHRHNASPVGTGRNGSPVAAGRLRAGTGGGPSARRRVDNRHCRRQQYGHDDRGGAVRYRRRARASPRHGLKGPLGALCASMLVRLILGILATALAIGAAMGGAVMLGSGAVTARAAPRVPALVAMSAAARSPAPARDRGHFTISFSADPLIVVSSPTRDPPAPGYLGGLSQRQADLAVGAVDAGARPVSAGERLGPSARRRAAARG